MTRDEQVLVLLVPLIQLPYPNIWPSTSKQGSQRCPDAGPAASHGPTRHARCESFAAASKHALATAVAFIAVFTTGVTLPLSEAWRAQWGSPVRASFAEEAEDSLTVKNYSEEFAKALAPMNTVRGVWRTRETRTDGTMLPMESSKLGKRGICKGRLAFKGFVGAGKGTVEYRGCGDREGKGRWLTKPKNIVNGKITLSARWKVNFLDGTSLLYRGDVVQDVEGTPLRFDAGRSITQDGEGTSPRPDAHIRGEVLRPTTSAQGTLSEKQIGEFEADLIELPTDDDRL